MGEHAVLLRSELGLGRRRRPAASGGGALLSRTRLRARRGGPRAQAARQGRKLGAAKIRLGVGRVYRKRERLEMGSHTVTPHYTKTFLPWYPISSPSFFP